MSVFLRKEWLAIQQENGRINQTVELKVDGDTLYAGEVRMNGQKKWILYGALPPARVKSGLEAIFAQARAANAYLVESNFNLSRWTTKETLTDLGARLTMPFGTYVMDLSLPEETILANMHQKHRKNIRLANRSNLTVREGVDPDRVVHLLDQSYGRESGRSHGVTEVYLASLARHFADKMISLSVWQGEELQSILMAVYDETRGFPLHAARSNKDVQGSSHLIQWEMMRLLKARGVAEFDMGGARPKTDNPRLQGIFRFKRQFGGRFEPCFYWEKVVNRLRYQAFMAVDGIRVVRPFDLTYVKV